MRILYEDNECQITHHGKWLYYTTDQTRIGILEDEDMFTICYTKI